MDKILKTINTPFYLLDLKRLNNNYESLKNEFTSKWGNLILGYSFKTNSLPWILKWVQSKGAYAEVVSSHEFELAQSLGFVPSEIIFNGPDKGWPFFEKALDEGAIVNLDSFHEIDWLKSHHPKNRNYWEIGLRINFDLESHCPHETLMGDLPGRFGFNIENMSFNRAVEELKKIDYVKIVGVHGHHSTKTKSLKIFEAIIKKMIECTRFIDNRIKYLDIGGGFFGDKPNTPSFQDYAAVITDNLSLKFDPKETALIIEPGAALIASPLSYFCKVIDVKEVSRMQIVTVDGSAFHINPQFHNTKFQTELITKNNEIIDVQTICGYTCIENDRMALLLDQKKLERDDYILFNNVGSYSLAMSPMFIKYYPSVIVQDDQKYFYARKEWDTNDFLSKSFLDNKESI